MIKTFRFLVILLGFLGFTSWEAHATHLIGGSMSYTYIGPQPGNKTRYKITLTIYRDCAQSTVLFDQDIDIGFYTKSGSYPKALAKGFTLLRERDVTPVFGGSNCSGIPKACIKEGFYEAFVDLPNSNVGYIAFWERCCRNSQNNIVDDEGQTYYVEIPPTTITNSSPYFVGVPSPYICANDLVSQLNSATDPDGDSLAYSLVHPFSGGQANDPLPALPDNLTFPFNTVTYRGGYNEFSPFGSTGTAVIDNISGLTTFKVPRTGLYAIAIEVREYRNGKLISTTRRDLQYIVVNCPPNDPPALSGNTVTTYEVEAGTKLCFPITIDDPNSDSIYMTSAGEVFTGANGIPQPWATLANKNGKVSVNSDFCWQTTCDHVRNNPYVFSVTARDNGCPYKSLNVTYNIVVKPFLGTNILNGPLSVCASSSGNIYQTSGRAGSTFNWDITGGTITGGQGTDRVEVAWGAGPDGTIRVQEISAGGCGGQWVEKFVTIKPPPAPDWNLAGPKDPCAFLETRYQFNYKTGWKYQWFVEGGTITGNDSSFVKILWGPRGKARLRVIQTNPEGCSTDTLSFNIRINEPEIEEILGSPSVCPYITMVDYYVVPTPGSRYYWTISGGTQSAGGNTNHIKVDWGGPGIGKVSVYEINKFGCYSDTVEKSVIINHVLMGMTPVGDSIVCEFTKGVPYKVDYTNRSVYMWTVSGGTLVSGNTTSSIIVDWDTASWGYVEVIEMSYDSITGVPCVSAPKRLDVRIAPTPEALQIVGPDSICEGFNAIDYYVQGFEGSSYRWILDGDNLLTFAGQGNDTIQAVWNKPGKYRLRVQETSKYGCPGNFYSLDITVHPKPEKHTIQGDPFVCMPNFSGIRYHIDGYPGSTFNWLVSGGQVVDGQGNDSVIIDFDTTATEAIIRVVEISRYGCVGDTVKTRVILDQPVIEILRVSHSLSKDNTLELTWKINNGGNYNSNFRIQRRLVGDANSWNTVGTVNGNDFYFEDSKVLTNDNAYEYRVEGTDLCGNTIYSAIHRSILVKGFKLDDYDANIYWTNYRGWQEGVLYYDVFRTEGEGASQNWENRGLDTTAAYTDGLTTFMLCYRIRGTEEFGNQQESYSNKICFFYEPKLYIPNAFTPTLDNLNEQFQLKGGSLRSFKITIYNRWGERVFESEDINKSWDGTFNGAFCAQDVYMYVVAFSGYDGRVQTTQGVVHLMR